MKKPISEATRSELERFARIDRGLDIHHAAGVAKIRATLMQSGWTHDWIDVPDPEGAEPEPDITSMSGEVGATFDERDPWKVQVKVHIHQQESSGGKEPVFVSVNERDARIQRGVDVLVPQPYVEALRNATEWIYDVDPDTGSAIEPPREVQKYPFSVVG